MEALIASYGDTSSDSDSELSSSTTITSTGATNSNVQPETTSLPLPPPPLSLLTPPNSLGKFQKSCTILSVSFRAHHVFVIFCQ